MRWMQTMLRGPSGLEELLAIHAGLIEGAAKLVHFEQSSLEAEDRLEDLIIGRVPWRPFYLLPDDPQARVALAPHVRLCGALPVPVDGLNLVRGHGARPRW